jgi:hypothetical protein
VSDLSQFPTQHYPRVPSRARLQHHPAANDGEAAEATRLDLDALSSGGALAEPTRPVPVVERVSPPPVVKPIPQARRREADREASREIVPGEEARLHPDDFIATVLGQQHELNAAHQAARLADRQSAQDRLRERAARRGRGMRGVLGWDPIKPPSLREEAEGRVRAAQREAERKLAHERRMDRLAETRSVVALLCLLGVFLLIVGMGWVGFEILTGAYQWAPTKVR